jgi:Histone methylation protein DOT1
VLIEGLRQVSSGLEVNPSIYEPERLRERLDVLDALDAGFGDLDAEAFGKDSDRRVHRSAHAVRRRLEAINAELYRSIRSEIVRGAPGHALFRWIQASASREQRGYPAPGPAYDWQDDLLSGILQLREPIEATLHPSREMVFYQPTPVRHILRLIAASALSESDVIVDLGSGLGHVPLLTSMLGGVRSIGIEVEGAYIASAQECAQSLLQSRVHFIHADARTADLSMGTVFYLYSPFTGSILADVIERLRKEGTSRPIKICTLGPCACVVAKESWITAATRPDAGQITLFRSSDTRRSPAVRKPTRPLNQSPAI